MKKHFITYGDAKFAKAKERIINEAKSIDWFDETTAYSDFDVSDDLKATGLMEIPRGGGLWSWKPDIINTHIKNLADGDILVYADAGCTINKSSEWARIEKILRSKEIIAQKILQRTYKWTRREIINAFSDNPPGWQNSPQFCATIIIIIISDFTRNFIAEWRQSIIEHPDWIKDVEKNELNLQYSGFIENRHDQAIYSALIYKYLDTGRIHTQWERIENYDIIRPQAIRATRLRNGEEEPLHSILLKAIKRIIQAYIIYPFFTIFK